MPHDTDILESTGHVLGCPSFLGFPLGVLMIRFGLCLSGRNSILAIWGLCGLSKCPLPNMCGFPLFYFMALGKTLTSFSFPSCVHHRAGIGDPAEAHMTCSSSGLLLIWPLISANCSRNLHRVIQSRTGSIGLGKRGRIPCSHVSLVPRLPSLGIPFG